MKFILETISYSYNKEDMEKLKKLGFQFKTLEYIPGDYYFKIEIDKKEHNGPPPSIEINSLEELMNFMDKLPKPKDLSKRIIIDKEQSKIIIYDGDICDEA